MSFEQPIWRWALMTGAIKSQRRLGIAKAHKQGVIRGGPGSCPRRTKMMIASNNYPTRDLVVSTAERLRWSP